MTVYQRLKIVGYRIINPIRRVYWFVVRPNTRGTKCLLENNNSFLLVRLNYAHRKWTLPGGGVNKKETFKDAAIRETKEEVGIDIVNPTLIGTYTRDIEYKKDTVEVYHANTETTDFYLDPVEIKEAKWFSRDSLPQDRQQSIDMIFEMYDRS